MYILRVSILLFIFLSSFTLASSSKTAKRQLWHVKKNTWFDRVFRKKPKGGEKEWKDEAEKNNVPSLDAALEHMERLDRYHEKLAQDAILEKTSIYVISPIMAIPDVFIDETQSILNPKLYNNNAYNIVFKLGKLYPVDKPYLNIYLSFCKHDNKPSQKRLVPIRSFFYDKHSKVLTPIALDPQSDERQHATGMYEDGFELHHTKDDAYFFSWTVPDESKLFPGQKYCFLFDMSNLNPSTLPYQETHDLHFRKPFTCMGIFCSRYNFHKLKVSPSFMVEPPPDMLSVEWFSRQFGGRDLERFMGGSLFSFTFFDILFKNGDTGVGWSNEMFQEHVNNRAEDVAIWFDSILKESSIRFETGLFTGAKPRKFDSGYSDAEDRRAARMRAIGLLYHPNGHKTLERIGNGLVEIANAYQNAYAPAGGIIDFLRRLRKRFEDFWEGSIGRFAYARRELGTWIGRLKKLTHGKVPSEEKLKQMSRTLGATHGMVKLPVTGESVHAPIEVKENILKYMGVLVKNEIQLVLYRMGERLLERKSDTAKFFDYFTGICGYDYQKYFAYAAVLKQYGTKFIWMAKNYAVFNLPEENQDKPDE